MRRSILPGEVHQDRGNRVVLPRQVKTGHQIAAVVPFGHARRSGILCILVERIDRCAVGLVLVERIGMERDHHIRTRKPRLRHPLFERDEVVALTGQHGAHPLGAVDRLGKFARQDQHQLGLDDSIPLGAGIDAPVAGIDGHGDDPVINRRQGALGHVRGNQEIPTGIRRRTRGGGKLKRA